MATYSIIVTKVPQDASIDQVRKILTTYGDADRQATQLSKLFAEGWAPVNAEGKRITSLLSADGKPVQVMVAGKLVPATPENYPMGFLAVATGLRFWNSVPQICPDSFVDDGTVPDVSGITSEQAIEEMVELAEHPGSAPDLIDAVNNGQRLRFKAPLKAASKRQSKLERVATVRKAFMALNPSHADIAEVFTASDQVLAMEAYLKAHPTK